MSGIEVELQKTKRAPVVIAIGLLVLVCPLIISFFQDPEANRDEQKVIYDMKQELERLHQEIATMQDLVKPPFRMPESMKLCGVHIDFNDPFIYRRVKKEINEIVFHEGMLGNLVDFSGEFFPIIEPILAEYNVPDDLKYLVAVESNFKIRAASYAGAKGPWQFIKAAAKQHGLKYNSRYDERYNLELASNAAVKHLIGSFKIFGDWLLALTAYNKGNRGVNNILSIQGIDLTFDDEVKENGEPENNGEQKNGVKNVDQNGIDDNLEEFMAEQRDSNFWDLVLLVKIVRRGKIVGYRNEQERYVPRTIAMKLILENVYDYDFLKFDEANKLKPIPTDTVRADTTISSLEVAKTLGMSLWNLKYLNPQYKGLYPVFSKGKDFKLPRGMKELYEEKKKNIKPYRSSKSKSRSSQGRRSKVKPGDIPKTITLRSGETLWDISQHYGVPMKTILKLNNITYRSARYLRPGKTIRLK